MPNLNLQLKSTPDTGQSKRKVIKIIEKHTGDDPIIHKWTFKVKERGKKSMNCSFHQKM
jgi:hypothetical protein